MYIIENKSLTPGSADGICLALLQGVKRMETERRVIIGLKRRVYQGTWDHMVSAHHVTRRDLVANDHILSHTLQAECGVDNHGKAPELAVMLAQIIGSQYGNGRFGRSNGIGSTHGWVSAIQVGGLNFLVADASLSCQPVFTGKQRSVGIRKSAPRRNDCESEKFSVNCFDRLNPVFGDRDRGLYH